MALRINDEAPNFTAETTQGTIKFHDWIGNGWVILFSHPKDFTPICTTELGYMAGLQPEFEKRDCKVLGISVDGVKDHEAWSKDIESSQGHAVSYPLIADPELKIVRLYDMLPADAGDTSEGRTAADNATARSVFLIGPDKKIKASLTYPMSTGRNFDEILRLLDSCQLTAEKQVATPVNWKQGEPVVILPSISDEDAKAKYPEGWDAPLIDSILAGHPDLVSQPSYEQRRHKRSYFVQDAGCVTGIVRQLRDAGTAARVVFSHDRLLDILPPNAGKAAAMRYIANRFGLPSTHVFAAGDSGNDIDMLTDCENAILVANHAREVASLAQRPNVYRARRGNASGALEGILAHHRARTVRTREAGRIPA